MPLFFFGEEDSNPYRDFQKRVWWLLGGSIPLCDGGVILVLPPPGKGSRALRAPSGVWGKPQVNMTRCCDLILKVI